MATVTENGMNESRAAAVSDALDGNVLEDIYREHWDALCRHATRLVNSPEAGEDVAQEAVIRAMQKLSEGEEVHHLAAWLHCCVHFTALDWLKRERYRRYQPLNEETATKPTSSTSEEVETRMQTQAVLKAIATLPNDQRHAFWLTEVNGFGYSSTAGFLGTSVDSVRQRLFRARGKIRRTMAESQWAIGFGAWLRNLSSSSERVVQAVAASGTVVAIGALIGAGLMSGHSSVDGTRPAPRAQPAQLAATGQPNASSAAPDFAGIPSSPGVNGTGNTNSGSKAGALPLRSSPDIATSARAGSGAGQAVNGAPVVTVPKLGGDLPASSQALIQNLSRLLTQSLRDVQQLVGNVVRLVGDRLQAVIGGLTGAAARTGTVGANGKSQPSSGHAGASSGSSGTHGLNSIGSSGSRGGQRQGRGSNDGSSGGQPQSGSTGQPTAAPTQTATPDASSPAAPAPQSPAGSDTPSTPSTPSSPGDSSGGGGGLTDLLNDLLHRH